MHGNKVHSLLHSQHNVSGNELETDLTWILNEKVKSIATQNTPLFSQS